MAAGKTANISSICPARGTDRHGIGRDEMAVAAAALRSPDLRQDLDRAFALVEEIRGIFEARQTYVLHTLLDLVAIEIRLLQKEQGGRYRHSERDIREAFSIPLT